MPDKYLCVWDKSPLKDIVIEYVYSVNTYVKGKIVDSEHELKELMKNFRNDAIYVFFGIMYANFNRINSVNVYYVNLESLTCDGQHSQFNYLESVLALKRQCPLANLLDYSRANVSILGARNIVSQYLPYYINFDEIKDYDKTYDIVSCCSWTPRLSKIYTPLSESYSGHTIGYPPLWGEKRDEILFRSKVLINLHYREKDYNILQELRVTRCILNKIIVISEHVQDATLYPLHNMIIFCDYSEIQDKVKDVLENYDEYFNKIYGGIDYNLIKKQFEPHLESIISIPHFG